MHPLPTSSHRRHGFTLIELLVVISIISLLIGILLPVLSSARGQARWAQCLSNMRQIGIAAESYLIDSDGNYWPNGQLPETINGGAFSWLGKAGTNADYTMPGSKRYLNSYLNEVDGDEGRTVSRCPSDETLYEQTGASYGANYLVDFRWNLFDHEEGDPDSPRKSIHQSVIREGSVFVVGAEYAAYPWALEARANITTNGMDIPESKAIWHSKETKWNLLFADGHVSLHDVLPGVPGPGNTSEGNSYSFEYK